MKTKAILQVYPEIEKNGTYQSLLDRDRRIGQALSGAEEQMKEAERYYRELKSASERELKEAKLAYKKARKIRKRYHNLLIDVRLLLKRWLKVYAEEQSLREERQWLTKLLGQEDGQAEKPAGETKARAGRAKAPADKPKTAAKAKASAKKKSKKGGDDLKRIKGIGLKIEQLLRKAGITRFEQLSGTDPERLREILDAAGPRYARINPESWPYQAKMAADTKSS
jgi:predicted flap endonuclease-1-like 5' DNA nuclease